MKYNKQKSGNQGFTVVELVVSFSITLVVILLLFQIVISLKDLYVKDGLKTELLIKQSLMTQKVAGSFLDNKIVVATKCSDEPNCLSFTFEDNSVKTLHFDKIKGIFHYGDYTTKLVKGSKFGSIDITNESFINVDPGKNDSVIRIHIPITHKLVSGDYGISINYLYDSRKVAVGDLNLSELTTAEQVFLKGNSMMVLQDTTFSEPGYYVRKTDGTIVENDARVTVSGTVGTNSGIYTKTYTLKNGSTVISEKKRTITVVKSTNNFDYTGSMQTFTVPVTGNYQIELWGAGGGNDVTNRGGRGAYTKGTITLNAGEKLYVFVGQKGLSTTANMMAWNGGGYGTAGSGGGATDIRLIGDTSWNSIDGLRSRIMVAGAGGGTDTYTDGEYGGDGGTLSGLNSAKGYGKGGTQTAGGAGIGSGSFGIGGSTPSAGGGGGGYYGGGSSTDANDYGGGGGSSFISGYDGCNAVDSSGNHTATANHYSGKSFIGSGMIAGNTSMPNPRGSGTMTGNTEHGYARITLISVIS